MSFKDDFQHRIPHHLQRELPVLALQNHIKRQKINTAEQLVAFLTQEIAVVERWLKENRKAGGTTVKTVRDKTVQLDVLKKCRQLTQEFLL